MPQISRPLFGYGGAAMKPGQGCRACAVQGGTCVLLVNRAAFQAKGSSVDCRERPRKRLSAVRQNGETVLRIPRGSLAS